MAAPEDEPVGRDADAGVRGRRGLPRRDGGDRALHGRELPRPPRHRRHREGAGPRHDVGEPHLGARALPHRHHVPRAAHRPRLQARADAQPAVGRALPQGGARARRAGRPPPRRRPPLAARRRRADLRRHHAVHRHRVLEVPGQRDAARRALRAPRRDMEALAAARELPARLRRRRQRAGRARPPEGAPKGWSTSDAGARRGGGSMPRRSPRGKPGAAGRPAASCRPAPSRGARPAAVPCRPRGARRPRRTTSATLCGACRPPRRRRVPARRRAACARRHAAILAAALTASPTAP